MTAIPQHGLVSEKLRNPLRRVAARQWNVLAARGALQALAVALVVLLPAALLLGHFAGMPDWVRWPLASLAWIAVLAAAGYFLRPALRRRSLADAAFLVEGRHPTIQERLSSAVELAGEEQTFAGSPVLVRHLVRQAEADAAAVKPETVVPADAVRKWAYVLVPLLALWLLVAILAPLPLLGGLFRVFMPWRDKLPAMLTRVAVTPGDVTVAEGDSLEIRAKVNLVSGPDKGVGRALLLTKQIVNDDGQRPLARDLAALAPREFSAKFDDLRQGFRYQVSTDQGESQWFTATVLPRPAISRLDLRYDYPAYTGLDRKVEENRDGRIQALQGTEVTLILQTTEPLDLAEGKSRITVTEGSRQRTLEVKPADNAAANVYEAKLTVFGSGSYRVQLTNRHGLTNRDDSPRPIVAEFDAPPKVAITAPQPQVTVRADDDVPVLYGASDDFGVATVQAVVQVDDKAPQEYDLPLRTASADRRQLEGRYVLTVPYHLGRAGVEDAKQVTYWLKVTDNRDPDPQVVESARQTLTIDNGQSLSYLARVEEERAKDLMQAIEKAIQRLNQSEGQVNSLKGIDANRAMNSGEKTRAQEQREHLATTSKELAETAKENLKGSFAEIAAKAERIAEGPILSAAENVAKTLLNGDLAEPRKRSAEEAAKQVVEAKKQLEELKKAVEARGKETQAAGELEKLAQRQTELAEQQAKLAEEQRLAREKEQAAEGERDLNRDRQRELEKQRQRQAREKFERRQRELHDRLNRTIGQSEPLRDAKAVEQAVRLRELIDRVEEIQKQHAPLEEGLVRQQKVAELREKAEDLAGRQAALNEKIERFADDRQPALQRAETAAPERHHQAAIVDQLRRGEVQGARDLQRQSVDRLKQAQDRLEQRGRSNDLKNPNPVEQQALDEAEEGKRRAEQAGETAKAAAEQLKGAVAAKDEGQVKEARKKFEEAADALTREARAAEGAVAQAAQSDDPTAKQRAAEADKAAETAQQAVETAKKVANSPSFDEPAVARNLDEAVRRLAESRAKGSEAIKADLLDEQRDAATAAAQQAKELAREQAELAEAAEDNADALAEARRETPSPQDLANRHNQLKDQAQQAAQQADQLEQLAKGVQNSDLAERASAAENLLREAGAAEGRAAESENAAAQAQQQAESALGQAGQAEQQAAQLGNQAAGSQDQATHHEQIAQSHQRQAASGQARNDAGAAQAAKQQSDQHLQQASQHKRQAGEFAKQAAAAEKRAADTTKQADAAQQKAAESQKRAAEQQARATEALAKAELALRDLDRLATQAVARRNPGEPAKLAQQDDGAQPAADAQPGAPTADNEAVAGNQPPPLTPEQAMRQAAQGAQEAAQAQAQSIHNDNAAVEASQQAAAALQQAAAAMAARVASNGQSESAVAGAEEQPGIEGEGDAQQSAARPGQSADPKQGIAVASGGSDDRPKSVQELGISAGDWARLGPLVRRELLNAAQQSGPPAYREMIKNYYIRIARLQRDGGGGGTGSRNGRR